MNCTTGILTELEEVISDQKKKVLAFFAEGRRHYKLMEFEKALACFQNALEIDPADGPSREYQKRCGEYIETPPSADWDGVYVMKTK
jgi:tetratricopeptide (TPR) repeat protein